MSRGQQHCPSTRVDVRPRRDHARDGQQPGAVAVMQAPVSEGELLLGKYRVDGVIGQGGMAIVVAATHIDFHQKVALKFLLPASLQHAELVERFAREARAAARIQSRHVARVVDTGRLPNGIPFLVMEYLEGQDLAQVLKREKQLAPAVAVDHVLQVCEALAEAHGAGIVHRDLKPANLFLAKQPDRRPIIKVLDFGISKMADSATPLTQGMMMVGTPHYMSPEQLESSKDVDARSDIWALGVILYELISGTRPFSGATIPEVLLQIVSATPAPLREIRADIPAGLGLAVSLCIAKQRERRIPSVADLAAAIAPFASDRVSASTSVARTSRILRERIAPIPADGSATGRDQSPRRDGEERRRNTHLGGERRAERARPAKR